MTRPRHSRYVQFCEGTSMAKALQHARMSRVFPRFGIELAKARKRSGLTNSTLQELTGISRPSLIGYEAGRNVPGAGQIRTLCQALRVTPNKLIFGTEKPFKHYALRSKAKK
jgi:transcriptional regulator with XRE-family HTH domain